MIRIKTIKLLKGNTNNNRTIPARISPIIEIISEGKVSLIIFPLILDPIS